VGEGVDAALLGRAVVTSTGGAGGYASRALAPAGAVIPVPDALDPEAAAALLADGRTATMLMALAEVRPGETVLVEAAAGGVGSLLVQLARAAGARVVAAAGGPAKCRLAMEVGANAAVDYGEPGWAERAGAVDVAFDGVGGAIGEAAFGLVRAGGRFLPYGMASGAFAVTPEDEATRRGVRIARGGRPDPAELVAFSRRALEAAAAGRLRPVIGQRVPLERAADAHRAIEERRTTGKTLLLAE
jgi:NADPH2:quinone reductase